MTTSKGFPVTTYTIKPAALEQLDTTVPVALTAAEWAVVEVALAYLANSPRRIGADSAAGVLHAVGRQLPAFPFA